MPPYPQKKKNINKLNKLISGLGKKNFDIKHKPVSICKDMLREVRITVLQFKSNCLVYQNCVTSQIAYDITMALSRNV